MNDRLFEKTIRDYNKYATKHDEKYSYGTIKRYAADNNISAIVVRKVLITKGLYKNEITEKIYQLFQEGNDITEIQKKTGLKRATVYSYLPYKNIVRVTVFKT